MFCRVHDCLATRRHLLLAIALIGVLVRAERLPAQIAAQAFLGQPFGVGRVEIQLDPRLQPEPLGLAGVGLVEKNGRILYPATDQRSLSPVVKEMLGQVPLRGGPVRDLAGGIMRDLLAQPQQRTAIYFLFTGDAPLEITVQYREQATVRVVPRDEPRLFNRLAERWWSEYTAVPGLLAKKADYPPLVDEYLRSMLALRLNLPVREKKAATLADELEKQFGMAMGTEAARIALVRDEMLRRLPMSEAADQPLPKPFEVPTLELPEVAKDVKTDPLAARVPEECFYVRFGTFSNFLWFQDMLATWGGDLQNLVALRGLDRQTRRRFEEQLVVRSSVLAKLLGDTVVADVAIIGTDLYLQDGGAYGLLFYAKSNMLLANDFQTQRSERLKKKDGVTDEKIKIGGRDVSYLSTPDGTVRSYYASDGNCHLVTSSRHLVERFFETGSGKGSLGNSAEFRYARSVLPQSRGDTVFIYLSDAFFRNFVSPHYQVELARRVRSAADIELVQLAMLASAAEGKPGETIPQLVQGGFLPPGFGRRPDGSETVIKDGTIYDTVRGYQGRFVPIPDVEVKSVAPFEARSYQQFAEMYQANWKRLDPVLIGLKRKETPNRREHLTIDARLTPVAKANYERLQQYVGAADEKKLAPVEGDVFAMELIRPDSRLFGGLQDLGMPFDGGSGAFLPEARLRNVLIGYLGTTGSGPILGILEQRMNLPDVQGMSSTPAGIWRRQYGPFNVYSLQPDLLMKVTPQLRFEPSKGPAQLHVRVADPTQSGVPPLLNRFGFLRTRETTLGNLRLMHQVSQQLHVPGPDAKATAERLLEASLICPFGGQYVYRKNDSGVGFWTSTFLESDAAKQTPVPPGFVTPPLNWFRGLVLDAQLEPQVLSVHAELDMQLPGAKAK